MLLHPLLGVPAREGAKLVGRGLWVIMGNPAKMNISHSRAFQQPPMPQTPRFFPWEMGHGNNGDSNTPLIFVL